MVAAGAAGPRPRAAALPRYARRMEPDPAARRERMRALLIGGVVGASAALAAYRRRRPQPPKLLAPQGLAAFEDAPCYRELLDEERARSSSA